MIVFENIKWKNFLSTGDHWTEINFTETSSTLIIGLNGAGKSTVLDALCFALFNKPFRRVKRGQLVNSINEKGLKVELEFSIGKDEYRVFRGAKPNVFELYHNNKLVDQDAANRDMQKYLEQTVLKLNFKSFTQVVILGSSTFVPFMQLTAPHRREVIEDLLDINIFSNMNSLLKDRVRSANSQNKDCTHMLRLAKEKVESQQKLINSLTEVNQTRQDEKQNKMKNNDMTIKGLEKERDDNKIKLENLQKELDGVDDQRSYIADLNSEKAEINADLKLAKKEIKFLETHDTCPTCTQEIDKDFKFDKVTNLQDKRVKLTKTFNKIKLEIADLMQDVKHAEDLSMQCHAVRTDIHNGDRDIVRLSMENLEINKELIDLQTNTPNIEKETNTLVAFNKELSVTEKNCSKISETIDEYFIVSNLLKDSGIKSQIIKRYVPVFNNLINKYLHSMDFFVNFTLDENFNEIIKSRFRDEFSYSSFSEGEKQKIDLALLFTWREIARMKNSIATNLLILDEVFDSSLDADGTAELFKILKSFGNDSNVFVISHKGEILVDKFLRTIKFEKINDFSKMSEDS